MVERIAVIGTGKIGLCLALNLARAGYDVLGIDQDRACVGRIREKTLRTPSRPSRTRSATRGHSAPTGDLAAIREFGPEIVFVAVDTTTADPDGYDPRNVDAVMRDLFALGAARVRTELALVCTVLPGYADSVAASAEAERYVLSYNPGFVAQGSIMRDQQFPDQVLIGEADARAGDLLEGVHRRMCLNQPAIHRMSRLSAEIAKLATNCYLTMKIAFANAIGDLAIRVGGDPAHILSAIGADTRIGSEYLRYGYGYGGPCFPRDNRALSRFAKRHDFELLQAEATDEMNRRHVLFQVDQHLRTHRNDEAIHLSSVTYKPGTEMLEESQALALAVQLARSGRRVVIHDQPAVVEAAPRPIR